jgi:hypothetical protein
MNVKDILDAESVSVQDTVKFIQSKKTLVDKMWIQDPSILIRKDRITDFFPSKNQKNEARLNSIVRLSLYASIALWMYYSDIKYLAIFLFVLGLTYVVYNNHPVNSPVSLTSGNENFEGESEPAVVTEDKTDAKWNAQKNGNWGYISDTVDSNSRQIKPSIEDSCIRPTVDNPFMNSTMKDYLNIDDNNKIVDRQPACDINDPKIKKQIDADFNNNLYKDVTDIFGKLNSQRNFYTMPWTTIPNDPKHDFAKWLYLSPKTCHEDQEACTNNLYEDIRANRPVFYNKNTNPVKSKV